MLAHSQSILAGCSLPVLSLYRRFIESQLFCLPEFHPLVIRNESHLRSISSPPSQSPNRRTSLQISSWSQSCERFSHPSGCGRPPVVCAQLWVCTARRWPGGYSWALGLHSTGDARGALSQAAGSHKPITATTVLAEKSLSFPCCLSLLVKWPRYSP